MTVNDAIKLISSSLANNYEPGESGSIARIVLEYMGFPVKIIHLQGDGELDRNQESFIHEKIRELQENCPVQYVLGETDFFGIKLKLTRDVLIPRQETEELLSMILQENHKSGISVIDLGTGSGCIAIALAKGIPTDKVIATDISKAVLKLAGENAKKNDCTVITLLDDMLDTRIEESVKFDVVVSNPPYVRDLEKQFMHPNVLEFEPAKALFVRDNDPLVYYRAIASFARRRLREKGRVYVEINESFGREVAKVFSTGGLFKPEIIRDIHGKERFVKAFK